MNKEQIYDVHISPLMEKIIEICKTNKIAFLASFSIPTEEDADLLCTSCMLEDAFEPPAEFLRAWREIRPGRSGGIMLRTENGDGSTTFTAIV